MKYDGKMRLKFPIFLILLGLVAGLTSSIEDEYVIKAVYFEKLSRFIQWPEASGITDTSRPFVIGVIGENPYDSILEKVYSTRKIGNKKVAIRHFSTLAEIGDCHILFISESVKKDLDTIVRIAASRSILTIGETAGFAQRGVHINFYIFKNKVRFEINPASIRKASLTIDSLLFSIARVIKSPEEDR